jgi:hypothetical protein
VDRCDECAFVYDELALVDVAATLRSVGPRYEVRIAGASDVEVRTRPRADVWSVLEYECHVRDVLRVQRDRVALALVEERPDFTPMRREARVVNDRYNEQDPAVAAAEITEAANALASAVEVLTPSQWERTGIHHWPATSERTVAWLARHTVHECEHHLRDIDAVLVAVRSATTTG